MTVTPGSSQLSVPLRVRSAIALWAPEGGSFRAGTGALGAGCGGCGLAGGPQGRRSGDSVRGGGGMAGRRVNVNVGVLGHIDSGKTALARALSTTASTAAFDKQPQSRERGITLDLGFSCFVVPLPGAEPGTGDTLLQVTLVDCPGHASLIRTIIGGERGPGREPGSGSQLVGWRPDSLGLAASPGGLWARTHSLQTRTQFPPSLPCSEMLS